MINNGANIFEEFNFHLMNDINPSEYFNNKLKEEVFGIYPLNLLEALKDTPQSIKHHPEGNVWNHTMLVIDRASKVKCKSESPQVFMWAALLHDIGKPKATKKRKGRITAYDHDKIGEKLAREFLNAFSLEKNFIDKVCKFVRWHMQTLFVVKDLPFSELDKMINEIDVNEIALLSLCDRLGRGELTEEKIKEEELNINIFVKKALGYGKNK